MARYFFHVQQEHGLIEDEEGSEHSSLEEAKNIALTSAREMIADVLKAEDDEAPVAIVIVEDGREVAPVRLADVIPAKIKSLINVSH